MSSEERSSGERASGERASGAHASEKSTQQDIVTHHISDVDTWGGRDRNFFVFACLSLTLGFFGFDHFYLRSFGTGAQKLLVNLFGFGFWYWWDVIQVITDGVVIQKEGLASPFDWIRGIGRGVFVKPNKTPGTSAKSYLLYAFLAVCFGFLGADKFYLGEMWQGAAKLLSCFNIFLLLFGWMWVAWDAFHAFFMMESVLKDGISPPMPYSFITPGTVPGDVFKIKKGSNNDDVNCGGFPCPPSISSLIPSIPIGEIYKGIVAPLMTPPLVRALEAIKSPPMPTGPEGLALPTATATVPTAATTQVLPPPETSVTATPSPPPPQTSPPPQGGGGRIEGGGGGIGAVIAGAMTALVVAGGAKGFFDILNKQFS